MSRPGASDPVYIASRTALLDALVALGPHARHAIVIGAHAVYLRAGSAHVAIAEATKDSDIAIDPRSIADMPHIEDAMSSGGFRRHDNGQPGMWLADGDIPVDLMVAEAVAGPSASQRRGWRKPPHNKNAVRRARGIEACLVDHALLSITALDPTDTRVINARVAGPAALIVAKTHKIAERLAARDAAVAAGGKTTSDRVKPKDAHDIYRIFQAIDTDLLADSIRALLRAEVCRTVTTESIKHLREMFNTRTAEGALLAGAAEAGVGDPDLVASSVALLTRDLLAELSEL
ncbi:MAG: hypothetical protein ACK5MR_00920 [Cumulibacter sp.]